MKLIEYVSINVLSLIGNIGLFIFLVASFGFYPIQGIAWMYIEENCGIWACTIAWIILIIPIDILINKILHDKFTINIPFKNEHIKYTYYVLSCFGIMCSSLYLLLFIWFITR